MDATSADQIVSSLYRDWYSSLLAYVFRLVGNRAEAEDIVQEAFMLLYRQCREDGTIENTKGWTLQVARRLAWKKRRAQNYDAVPGDTNGILSRVPARELDPEQRLIASRESVVGFLGRLTAREVEVVLLRLEGLKYREIARALEISPSSVNTLLARALSKLRGAMREELGDRSPVTRYVEELHSRTLQ